MIGGSTLIAPKPRVFTASMMKLPLNERPLPNLKPLLLQITTTMPLLRLLWTLMDPKIVKDALKEDAVKVDVEVADNKVKKFFRKNPAFFPQNPIRALLFTMRPLPVIVFLLIPDPNFLPRFGFPL